MSCFRSTLQDLYSRLKWLVPGILGSFMGMFPCGAEENPLHHWQFSEEHWDGKLIASKVGGLRGGVLTPPMIDEGAVSFDGTKNRIRVAGVSGKDLPAKAITVDAWVVIDKGHQWGNIIGFMQDNDSYERGWSLGYNQRNLLFWISSGGPMRKVEASATFETGEWLHVAGTYDGDSLRVYVNGELQGEKRNIKGMIAYPDEAYYTLGAYEDKDEFYPMHGRLREARVFDRALTETEIRKLAQSGKAAIPEKVEFAVVPALRFNSPTTATVFWESTLPGTGAVNFGKTRKLGTVVSSASKGTSHEVELKGLEFGTAYHYKVGMQIDGKRRLSPSFEFHTELNFTVPGLDGASSGDLAGKILSEASVSDGYSLAVGVDSRELLTSLAAESELVIFSVLNDPKRAEKLRAELSGEGIYGSRVSVLEVDDYGQLPVTRCFANLVIVDEEQSPGLDFMEYVTPGRGVLVTLSGNRVKSVAVRPPLDGIGEWTHQYGDASNRASNGEALGGTRQTGDLKVQWVGRPGGNFGIDRNPRMPAPVASNGRLFHQGMNRIAALDSYNGAILWSMEIPNLRRVNIPRDCSNWCVDADQLYVAVEQLAWVIDAATGQRKNTLSLPGGVHDGYHWGFIARESDRLFGSRVRKDAVYTGFWGSNSWYDGKGAEDGTGKVTSDELFAYDAESWTPAWRYQNGVIINSTISVGGGNIYFVESRNKSVVEDSVRQISSAELWQDQFLVALNADDGSVVFEQAIDTEDGNLAFYTQFTERGVVATASNTQFHLYCFDAKTGKQLWQNSKPWPDDHHSGHIQHPVVVNDTIYLQPNGYSLETGKVVTSKVGARSGCHTYVGARDCLIYRGENRQIAVWDQTQETVTSWTRLRPSCWLSVVPSNGMLLVPEGGAGCSCGGWMETSLVFAPRTVLGYSPLALEGGAQ